MITKSLTIAKPHTRKIWRTGRFAEKGLKGACYCPQMNREKPWIANIRKDGKKVHLGYFDTEQEAHEAYWKTAQELHLDFARAA